MLEQGAQAACSNADAESTSTSCTTSSASSLDHDMIERTFEAEQHVDFHDSMSNSSLPRASKPQSIVEHGFAKDFAPIMPQDFRLTSEHPAASRNAARLA